MDYRVPGTRYREVLRKREVGRLLSFRRRLRYETLEDRRLLTVPTFTAHVGNQTIFEGALLDLSNENGAPALALFDDSDSGDTHTGTVDWGDGSLVQNATVIPSSGGGAIGGSHTYADNGTYTVTVTVQDNDGGSDAAQFTATVHNVAPFVDVTGPTSVNEGSPTNWNLGPVVDPGTDTVTQYIIHWGDTNTDTYTSAQIAGASNTVGHTYADGANNYTISVDLVDEDGTHSSVDTLNVMVKNVAPFVDVTGPTSVNEGSPTNWNLGPVVDPGTDTVTQYIIHWGDTNTDTYTSVQIAGASNTVGHTYADGTNNYTISVDLVDEDGTHSSVDTLNVMVKNVPPSINLNAVPNISENGVAILTGSYTDIGLSDVHKLTINWGDPNNSANSDFDIPATRTLSGTPTFASTGADTTTTLTITSFNATTGLVTFSVQHQYLDDGLSTTTPLGGNNTASDNSTITVSVADDDTVSDTKTTSVIVGNVPPVVALNAASSINENGVVTLTGSYTDIGLSDFHQLTVNWGDPNNGANSVFAIRATRTFSGTPTFTSTGADTTTILTITSFNSTTGLVTFSVQHQYLDDGLSTTTPPGGNNTASENSTITVTVADDDTNGDTKTTSVTVNNVAPVVALNAVTTIDEIGVATLIGSYTDVGLSDVHKLTVNWGDPNSSANSVFNIPATRTLSGTPTFTSTGADTTTTLKIISFNATTGQVSFFVKHQYLDGGLAIGTTIGVTAADDDTQSGTGNATVTANAAPTVVTPNGNQTIFEGGTVSFANLATFTDPENITDPLHESFTYDINWGDSPIAITGSSVAGVNSGPNTPSSGTIAESHTYADDGTYTVTVTVHDDDGGSAAAHFSVTVNNRAPTVVTPNGNQTILAGGTVSFTNLATFTDPGFDNPLNQNAAVPPNIIDPLHESFTYDINWGDGHDAVTGVSIADINGGPGTPSSGTIAGSHTYANDGTYTATVTVHDDNGGATSAQFTVKVNKVGPVVGADLQLTSSGPTSVVAGKDTVKYTFTVKNIGTLDATNVKISLASILPPGVTVKSISAPKNTSFSGSGGNGTWTIASLKKKESQTLTVTFTVGGATEPGTNVIRSTATAVSTNQGLINTGDDSTTRATSVTTTVDVSISKHTAPNNVQAGGNALFTVIVSNSGPGAAKNVSLVDLLPAGTTFVSQTQTGGPAFTLSNTTTQVTNTIASLASGASATFAILVHVDGNAPNGQKLNNKATVTTTSTDTKTSNNSSTATTCVSESAASLQASITDPSRQDLVITGSSKKDSIEVKPASGGKLGVTLNGKSLGNFSPPTGNIVVYGRAGDDTIVISPLVTQTALVFGGSDNDTLTAGGGNTVLSGGDGKDKLTAGIGRNLLIGGRGANTLTGLLGSNVLVGGYTNFDSQQFALEKLLAEWSHGGTDYVSRVHHLNGTLTGGLNGAYVLNATTVTDNESIDQLFAGLGSDWFLADRVGSDADQIASLQSGEEVLDI